MGRKIWAAALPKLTVLNCPAIVYVLGARHELVWSQGPCDAQDCEAVFRHEVGSRIQPKAACKDDCAPQAIRKSQCHGILTATAPFALLGRFVTRNLNFAEF